MKRSKSYTRCQEQDWRPEDSAMNENCVVNLKHLTSWRITKTWPFSQDDPRVQHIRIKPHKTEKWCNREKRRSPGFFTSGHKSSLSLLPSNVVLGQTWVRS